MSSAINKFLLKFLNFPIALRSHFYPIFNRWFFRANGVQIGKNFFVMGRVSIVGPGKIEIGDDFCMSSGDYVNPIASNLRGAIFTETKDSSIVIGNNVGMSSTRMWVRDSLTIGDNVCVGANVLFIDTDSHPLDYLVRRTSNEGTKSKPIVIEDDVWIGAHTIVLKGVTIGARTVIGAGSIVTKDIPSDCIAAGNPCKVIRTLK